MVEREREKEMTGKERKRERMLVGDSSMAREAYHSLVMEKVVVAADRRKEIEEEEKDSSQPHV